MDLPRPPRPPRWKRRLLTFALVSLSLGLLLLAAGYFHQQHYDATFRAQHPAPGKFVTVHQQSSEPGLMTHDPRFEHRIHYRLLGEGDVTFVLEAGLGDYSGNWGALEDGLAQLGRVFVYDRAGLGWSEPCLLQPGPARTGNELGAILKAAQVPAPYILVGHSLGALSDYVYLSDSRGLVAGLLLIDPSHPDQFKRLPPPPTPVLWLMPQLARMAPTGLPQLLMGSDDPMQNTTWHVQTTGAEFQGARHWMENMYTPPIRFGSLPLYVLTAGSNRALPGNTEAERQAAWETWNGLHEEWLAASSSDIRQHRIVPGASHYIHRTHPAAVLEAARDLLQRIKARPGG